MSAKQFLKQGDDVVADVVRKPDFYVATDGTTLPATGYRYMDFKYAEQTMRNLEAPGSYIGFSKFDSAKQV